MKSFYCEDPFPTDSPRFKFDLSEQTPEHHFNILQECNSNLFDALPTQKNTPHHPLEPNPKKQPTWKFTSKILQEGASYPL
jgi:hypothetical protein